MQEYGWKPFSVEKCMVHSYDPPSGGNYYRSTDKSLAWPGRKQATAKEDFEFHIVKKFPAFYETRRFTTAFTSSSHLSLSYIQPPAWNMDYIKFWPGSFYTCLLHWKRVQYSRDEHKCYLL